MPLRLSTRILASTINLFTQLHLQPSGCPCREVLDVAMRGDTTWARTVCAHLQQLQLPLPGDWCQHADDAGTRSARKRRARQYMQEVVQPALLDRETSWREKELARLPLALPQQFWAELANIGVAHRWVLQWVDARFKPAEIA